MYYLETFNERIYHIGIIAKSLFVPIVTNKSFSILSSISSFQHAGLCDTAFYIESIYPEFNNMTENEQIYFIFNNEDRRILTWFGKFLHNSFMLHRELLS